MACPDKEITLYFKLTKTISVNVKRSDTIRHLKFKIHQKEGISEDLQDLFFAGNWLDKDELRVMDYGIPENSTINLVQREAARILLYFKPPSDQKFELEVQKNDTIQKIKSIIQAGHGMHPSKYDLYYAGKPLENFRTVASLNIKSQTTLQIIFTPKDIQTIYVEPIAGDTLVVEVRITHTIYDIKKIIESMTNIPSERFELFIRTEKLRNVRTLASYDIKYLDQEDIKMVLVTDSRYEVLVQFLKTVIVEVTSLDIVLDLKEKLFRKTGTPVHQQRIVFNGEQLEDERTLAHYNVEKGSKLHLHLRLRGGPFWIKKDGEYQPRPSSSTNI